MNIQDINNAKYVKDLSGNVSIIRMEQGDNVYFIPVNEENEFYQQVMDRVSLGTLTIDSADE